MRRQQRNILRALVVLLVVCHYYYSLGLLNQPIGEPGTNCSSFRSAQEILADDLCFPPITSSSSHKISANVERDVEAFTTSNWQSPTDCINGKEFWGEIRNSPAVVKSFDHSTIWKQFSNTYFRGADVFSVSHRCSGRDERPWYLSWILPVVHTKTFKTAYLDASQYWGEAFYHAIQEKGFMLGVARTLLTQNPDMVIIVEVLPPKLAEFAQEILGIPLARFHVMSFAVLVERLYVPYGADCAVQSAQHTLLTRDWIRDRHPALYGAEQFPTDIVIIHRNETGVCKRCLMNSGELLAAFRNNYPLRTVHLVTLGELPYVQVMELLAKTDLLIAPHGAGLTNMILLPNGAKVIEVMNKRDQCNFCFYELSLGLGLQYKAVSPLKTGPSTVDFDRADIEHVLAVAGKMMSTQ